MIIDVFYDSNVIFQQDSVHLHIAVALKEIVLETEMFTVLSLSSKSPMSKYGNCRTSTFADIIKGLERLNLLINLGLMKKLFLFYH